MSSSSRVLAPRKGLEWLLMEMGRTRPSKEPRHGLQAGKSGYPSSRTLTVVWGPRLISRDHRMHVYSDPRDQCSLNTQKLNNKSLTSIHTVLHK